MAFEDDDKVTPNGGTVRRLRRDRGWSRRALVKAIADATERESGVRQTLTVNQIEWIEESSERVAYATVCRIAAGLDCNPVELLQVD
ncbi:MAG: hypothetical protein QNK05_15640 [Myxococcota bacterium]|nr:hypothetical protein [Myxococcota bacterium]